MSEDLIKADFQALLTLGSRAPTCKAYSWTVDLKANCISVLGDLGLTLHGSTYPVGPLCSGPSVPLIFVLPKINGPWVHEALGPVCRDVTRKQKRAQSSALATPTIPP